MLFVSSQWNRFCSLQQKTQTSVHLFVTQELDVKSTIASKIHEAS